MPPMTRLERWQAHVSRAPMDRPLRRAAFTADLRERLVERIGGANPAAYFDMDVPRIVGLRPPEGYQKPDFSRYFEDVDLGDTYRITEVGCARVRGDFYHFDRLISPLRNATSLDDIEAFPIETCEGWTGDHMAAEAEAHHAAGEFVQSVSGPTYENAWAIRGYEPFLTDMIERPEWVECILDRLTERNVRRAQAAARAGADILKTSDDVANQNALMFSPAMWRKFLKPRMAKVYLAAREIKPDIAIWYHSDGNCQAIIDDLIEIGLTILNPVQPECMDLVQIQKRYGDRLLFDAAVGTQSTFPWGTPDAMRAKVRELRELFGGALLLAPTHVLEPEVPLDNILAFFEAASEPFARGLPAARS